MSSSAAGGDGPPPSGPGVVRPFSSRSSRSASRFGRQERQRAVNEQFQEEIQQVAEDLDVRVRERDPIGGPMEERPRSRLGSMFKSGGGAGDSSSATGGSAIEQKASELKETLTRPLSSLFRRSNSNDRSQPGPQHPTAANQASLPPAPARQVPTARGPLQSNSGNSGSFGGAAVSSTVGSRRGPGDAAMGNGMVATIGANVNAAAAATTTTTATRPFSGFPGKRPAAAASLAQPQHQPGTESSGTAAAPQLETDLSEQAAIAPHVNVHRFSDLAGDASLFLPMSGQQPQSSVNAKGGSSQIDVNFLSRFLCPEDEIQDEQIPWTWDSLFASVTSELREEWALEEEANNEAVDTAGGAGIPIPNGTMQQQQQRYTQQKGF